MKNCIAFLLLVIATSVALGADPLRVRQVENLQHGLRGTVALVPPEENCGFFAIDVPKRTDRDDIAKHWKPGYTLLLNGGYFQEDFSPVGLVRIGGAKITRRAAPRLSGFVAIDKQGHLSLLTRADDLAGYATIIQSGPYVVGPGGIVGIKSDRGQTARRTVIGLTREQGIIVAVTEPITLTDLARGMLAEFPSLDRLLNLDGGPSTALKTESIQVLNDWPVRNYIGKQGANVGCARSARMSQSDVVRIAGRAATAAGYKLADYQEPEAHFEFVRKDGSWTVFYVMKPPTLPGGHFQVWVDDKTGKTQVMPGE